MRSFDDERGTRWDAAIGKESYGAMVLLFSRRAHDEVLEGPLRASTRFEAEDELARMSLADLRGALASSVPWDGGGGASSPP